MVRRKRGKGQEEEEDVVGWQRETAETATRNENIARKTGRLDEDDSRRSSRWFETLAHMVSWG